MSERIIKNIGSGLAARVWTVVLGLVALPVLVRGLGAERYGLLALSLAVIGFASIADLGVGRAASKFIAEDYERHEFVRTQRFLSTALCIVLATGVFGAVLIAALTPMLVRHVFTIEPRMWSEARLVFFVTAAGLLAVLLRILFDGVLVGHHRIVDISAGNVLAATLKILLSIAAILSGFALVAVVIANVAVCYLHAIGLGWYTHRYFAGKIRFVATWDWEIAKQLLSLGMISTLSLFLGYVVFLYADRLIISIFLPLAMTGYYTMSFDVSSKQCFLSYSVAQAYFPVFSGKAATDAAELERSYLMATKTVASLVTGIAMLLIVFSKEILSYWLNPDVAARSSHLLVILALGMLLSCYADIPYNAIIAGAAQPLVTAKIFAVAVLLHVGGSIVLIRTLHAAGVAIAFAAAYAFVLVAFLWWISRYFIRVPLNRIWRKCFAVSWACAAGLGLSYFIVLKPLVHNLLSVAGVFVIGYLLYLGCCFFFGYSGSERERLLQIGRNFLRARAVDSIPLDRNSSMPLPFAEQADGAAVGGCGTNKSVTHPFEVDERS